MFDESTIAQVRDRTDLAVIIGERVSLKKLGRSYKGLCPFHQEKTPSFHVHPDRGYFYCFGCHASGDAFAFLMKLDGLTFIEALRELAERAGIELEEARGVSKESGRQRRSEKERLLALNEQVTRFFEDQLARFDQTHVAHRELEARKVSLEAAHAFRLGYAPNDWKGLTRALLSQGFSLDECERAGVTVLQSGRGEKEQTKDNFYDRFRHRLMFPIMDATGKPIAFSGRLLESAESDKETQQAKYVNSPETPLYRKGANLFGLSQARKEMHQSARALLCEGNFDALALHAHGFRDAVAPLGTALTAEQAQLLHRYVGQVVVLFDGDQAGHKAAQAAVQICTDAGLSAYVALLPKGHDPDSFLRAEGSDALKQVIAHAELGVHWMIDLAAEKAGADPKAKADSIEALAPLFRSVTSPVEANLYLERIMSRFQLRDRGALRKQLRQGWKKAQGSVATQAPSAARVVRKAAVWRAPEIEGELIGILLDVPELIMSEEAKSLEELLTSAELQAIFQHIRLMMTSQHSLDAIALLKAFEGQEVHGWLSGRLSLQKYTSKEASASLSRGLIMLTKRHTERHLSSLASEIKQALRAGDVERANALRRKHLETARGAKDWQPRLERT